jgi:hypothetical protein
MIFAKCFIAYAVMHGLSELTSLIFFFFFFFVFCGYKGLIELRYANQSVVVSRILMLMIY